MIQKGTHFFTRERIALAGLLAVLASLVLGFAVLPDHKGPQPAGEPGVLRVAAAWRTAHSANVYPYGPGLDQELLQTFAKGMGLKVRYLEAENSEEAWRLLSAGSADLAIGYGLHAPASLDSPVAAGPAYGSHRAVIVRNRDARAPRTLQADGSGTCEEQVLVAVHPALADSTDVRLDAAQCDVDDNVTSSWSSARSGPRSGNMAGTLAVQPVLTRLDTNQARYALVDAGRFRQWQPFFTDVRPASSAPVVETEARWIWSRANVKVAKALDSFWRTEETETLLADLREKYSGFLPERTDYYDLRHLRGTLENKLPRYREYIAKAARDNDIDPLLLVALIYQESHFDPQATSRTNVRGIMQITLDTARFLGIDNRLNPAQAIEGGARYLRSLYDRLEPYGLDEWDRWFLALASYNQGLGHVFDAMDLSRNQGGTGRTWREVKEAFPLLSYAKYYNASRHGYTRGREAVHYVDSIRYYYYVLRGLVVLSRPEAEHLGPLLAAVPSGWPLA